MTDFQKCWMFSNYSLGHNFIRLFSQLEFYVYSKRHKTVFYKLINPNAIKVYNQTISINPKEKHLAKLEEDNIMIYYFYKEKLFILVMERIEGKMKIISNREMETLL